MNRRNFFRIVPGLLGARAIAEALSAEQVAALPDYSKWWISYVESKDLIMMILSDGMRISTRRCIPFDGEWAPTYVPHSPYKNYSSFTFAGWSIINPLPHEQTELL